MSEGNVFNERELLELGMSRANVATLRNIQRITGGTIVDATELSEVIAIVVSSIGEMRTHVSSLKREIEELRVNTIHRQPVKTQESECVLLTARRDVKQPETDTVTPRMINVASIQNQIDEIKTYLGI